MGDKRRLSSVLKLILASAAFAVPLLWSATPAHAGRPLVALFDLLPADDGARPLAADCTKLVKTYMRDDSKVDVLQVRADMASVRLSIAEGTITKEDVAKLSDPGMRPKIAKAIRADYALGGAVGMNGDKLSMAVELVEIKTGKKWEGSANVSSSGSDPVRSQANMLQSAANTVVQQLSSDAFAALPRIAQQPAPTEDTTPAPPAPTPAATTTTPEPTTTPTPAATTTTPPPAATTATPAPTVTSGESDSRAQHARELLDQGNVAGAIYELRRAVQFDPQNPNYRVLLAKAYIKRSMYDEATRELNRVVQLDPENNEAVDVMADLYDARGMPGETINLYERMIQKKPEDPRLRIKLGDLLWKKAKIDDAIKNFEAAATLETKNPVVYDRLSRCYAAKSNFDQSLKELDELAKIEPSPAPATVAERYSALMVIVEGEIKSISSQFDQSAKAYDNDEHTREQYYEIVRGLVARSDDLTRFLDKVPTPQGVAAAHSHRVLACSLLSQAGTSLMSFLETDESQHESESKLYLTEARKELALAAG